MVTSKSARTSRIRRLVLVTMAIVGTSFGVGLQAPRTTAEQADRTCTAGEASSPNKCVQRFANLEPPQPRRRSQSVVKAAALPQSRWPAADILLANQP